MNAEREEAEKGLLGAILLSPERFKEVEKEITPEDFENLHYGNIFSSMKSLSNSGQEIDVLLLKKELDKRTVLELHELMNAAPTSQHIKSYVNIIKKG